jgi:tetratricopeptide (TPR) repeat protein
MATVFAASDREECAASADNSEEKIASCARFIADATETAEACARAYDSRGRAYSSKNDHERAIDDSEAIKLDPNDVEAYVHRALAHFKRNELDSAIADCSEGTKINPSYPVAHNNRGLVFFRKNDYDRAIVDFSEAIRLNGAYAFACDNRGFAYAAKRDLDSALADYNQAIKLDPGLAVARAHRGVF